jgi:hypothetical protein
MNNIDNTNTTTFMTAFNSIVNLDLVGENLTSDDINILIKQLQAKQNEITQKKKQEICDKAVVKAIVVADETTVKDIMIDAREDVKSGARTESTVSFTYRGISVVVG